MKDQFEKNIKSLVEDFSYDYDPKAWEALSKQLPQAKSGFSLLGKLAIAAILTSGALAIWLNTATSTPTKTTQPVLVKKEKSTETKIDTPAKTKLPAQQKNTLNQASNTILNASPSTENNPNFNAQSTFIFDPQSAVNTAASAVNIPENLRAATETITKITSPINSPLLLPESDNSQTNIACQGMKITLTAESITYETGYPVIHINAETAGLNMVWNANGSLINQKAKGADLLAFKQQTYQVSAQVSNEECHTTETLSIASDQNYNLLAVNAFNPQSRDERNARFMPFALTVRELKFEMIIIDPDNGAVIFKSSDAQNAWDGIDQRTGQLVVAQKAYIWKVVIENPLPGEKNTYTGTIVRI
jgi:hypothetical protein